MWRTRSDMAYTKIKPVRHHLQRCLDYTSNPQKTELGANDLNRLLSYTQNQDKTEHQLYVTGFNCTPADACRRMYRTKKRLNQPVDDGSILAYHIYTELLPPVRLRRSRCIKSAASLRADFWQTALNAPFPPIWTRDICITTS